MREYVDANSDKNSELFHKWRNNMDRASTSILVLLHNEISFVSTNNYMNSFPQMGISIRQVDSPPFIPNRCLYNNHGRWPHRQSHIQGHPGPFNSTNCAVASKRDYANGQFTPNALATVVITNRRLHQTFRTELRWTPLTRIYGRHEGMSGR